MTKNRARKQATRAAMAATGDNYTRARRHTSDQASGADTAAGEPGRRSFPVGVDADGAPVLLSETELRTHMLTVGCTGSGRSGTVQTLVAALLDLGWSGILLDPKDNGSLGDWCRDQSARYAVPHQELRLGDPSPPAWFDLFAGLGSDRTCDTVLALDEFADPYWRSVNRGVVGQAVNLLTWAHQADPATFPAPTLYELARILSSGNLPAATRPMRTAVLANPSRAQQPDVTDFDLRLLENPSRDHAKAAAGFGAKLSLLFDTPAGRGALRPDDAAAKGTVDVTAAGLTYVGVDHVGKPDLARLVTAAVLRQLSAYATRRGADPHFATVPPRFVVVEEASWVDRPALLDLLSRARAARIVVLMYSEGPGSWEGTAGASDWHALTANTNVTLVLRQGTPADATRSAVHLGTHHGDEDTAAQGVGPETLRTLGNGEAVLRVFMPARVQRLTVTPPDPRSR